MGTVAPTLPTSDQRGHRRRRRRIAVTVVTNLVLTAAVVTFLGLAVGPRLLPYRTVTMLTGSMAPEIEPGDVAIVTALPATQIRPGQVLTFQAPTEDRRVVTHRVIEVTVSPAGTVAIRTKGDANPAPDPWVAQLNDPTAWQVRAVVPELGSAIRTLREPAARTVLTLVLPAVLVGWILLGLWRPRRQNAGG